MTKFCGSCKEEKPDGDFNKRKLPSGNYTLQSWCKGCQKENLRAWRKSKWASDEDWREQQKLKAASYRENNPEFKEKVILRQREISRKHYQNNKSYYISKDAKRRANKLSATPKWLSSEQRARIDNIYKVCKSVSEKTGKTHHVDHIVPLQGENVCGLHVPWNLAIIPAEMNLTKGNKHE